MAAVARASARASRPIGASRSRIPRCGTAARARVTASTATSAISLRTSTPTSSSRRRSHPPTGPRPRPHPNCKRTSPTRSSRSASSTSIAATSRAPSSPRSSAGATRSSACHRRAPRVPVSPTSPGTRDQSSDVQASRPPAPALIVSAAGGADFGTPRRPRGGGVWGRQAPSATSPRGGAAIDRRTNAAQPRGSFTISDLPRHRCEQANRAHHCAIRHRRGLRWTPPGGSLGTGDAGESGTLRGRR